MGWRSERASNRKTDSSAAVSANEPFTPTSAARVPDLHLHEQGTSQTDLQVAESSTARPTAPSPPQLAPQPRNQDSDRGRRRFFLAHETTAASARARRSSNSPLSIYGHEITATEPSEAITEPTDGPTAGAGDIELETVDMAGRKTPMLRHGDGKRSRSSPYGSTTNSRNASSESSDIEADDALNMHRASNANLSQRTRSLSSRRSMVSISQQSSRLSEDIDGTALVSGMDGRFGVGEAALPSEIVDHNKLDDSDSDQDSIMDDSAAHIDIDVEENSPHELVRASVPPTDDTTLSINTPRMWCLSVLFSILGSSTNLFFSLRYPSVAITPVIALLLVHPLGHLWDFVFKRPDDPEEEFVEGSRTTSGNMTPPAKRRTSWRLWLGQGRWNEKEHTCVYVSSNVAFGFAFATDVIVEQTQFYSQPASITYQLLLTISTQILGYGFAGMARRFLVRPSGMIWPGTLMSAAMFSTLHKQENKPANGWTVSRWKFFYIVWSIAFAFYFLPGLLMPALSYFSVITWFAPKNVVIANLFGVTSGLGLFPMTFDWAQITYVGSPLLVPFWAAMNVIGGLAIVMWIIAPIMYYSNVVYSSYLPILSTGVFDNTGKIYNVSRILTSEFLFDREAYTNYSRVFLPVTYMLSYGMQFAGLAALLTHTFCWHGKDIVRTWKKAIEEARQDGKPAYRPVAGSPNRVASTGSLGADNYSRLSSSTSNVDNLLSREDIHCRLMSRYQDAPLSWYLLTFASMTAIGIFIVE